MKYKIVEGESNKIINEKLRRIASSYKAGICEGFFEIGKYLKSEVKEGFRKPKSGRVYLVRIKGITRLHRASAPNETPAILTGSLEGSISTKISGATQLTLSAGGAPMGRPGDPNYPEIHEESSRSYLKKAIRENERNTVNSFYRNIGKRLVTK